MHGLPASLLTALAAQQAVYESPASPTCGLDRGIFCVLDHGMEIEERAQDGEESLTIYAARLPEQAAIVSYTTPCRALRADSPRLAGYSPYEQRSDRIYLKLVFRLAEGCFLTVTAPSYLDRQKSLLGLSIALPIIRLCEHRPCSGRPLQDVVPQRLRNHWFSRRP